MDNSKKSQSISNNNEKLNSKFKNRNITSQRSQKKDTDKSKNLINNIIQKKESIKENEKASGKVSLDTKVAFKSKNIFAVLLVFVLTVFSVASVVVSGNFSSETAVTANISNTRIVQAKLASLGYFNDEIDGIYDSGTIEAIKNYQSDKNLAVTGSLDQATTTALGVTDNTQANTDLYLLAKLIYSEARGEIYEGQVAVGAVVLNRVADAGFPNTLQGVIYQPWAFTALHDGQFNLEPNGTAYQAAQDAMNGWDPTYGCIFYYNPRTATSSWIFSRQIIVTIGNHVFCI